MTLRRILTLLCSSLAFISACAASGPGAEPTDPDVAIIDPRFDGDFTVSEIHLSGSELVLLSAPNINIESTFAGLTIKPGCNTYFGSLSLEQSGHASFTVAGGTNQACAHLAEQETMVLGALDQVDGWEELDDGFRLFNSSGTELTLIP